MPEIMKKSLTTPRRPSGFNEYLPAEQIDLHIARGLDYYTGTVYETTLDDWQRWAACVREVATTIWQATTRQPTSPE